MIYNNELNDGPYNDTLWEMVKELQSDTQQPCSSPS